MNLVKRHANESEFDFWEEMPNGGRKYWFDIQGKVGGFARYIKQVDANERTTSFIQEIYNKVGTLVEIHEKYPIDKGHKSV